MDAAVLGDRLPEVTQKPFPRLKQPLLQCQHWESSKVLAGLVFFSEGRRGGQQQFATQTLRVHLLGLDMRTKCFKSRNRKRCWQTGSRQSTPLSTIRTRYGNSVSTSEATQTCKTQQNSLQKGSRYGISVLTLHRRYGHRSRTPFLRMPFPRLLLNISRFKWSKMTSLHSTL